MSLTLFSLGSIGDKSVLVQVITKVNQYWTSSLMHNGSTWRQCVKSRTFHGWLQSCTDDYRITMKIIFDVWRVCLHVKRKRVHMTSYSGSQVCYISRSRALYGMVSLHYATWVLTNRGFDIKHTPIQRARKQKFYAGAVLVVTSGYGPPTVWHGCPLMVWSNNS